MKYIIQTILTHWPSLTLLALAALPASYMHAHDHGKLKGWGSTYGFFGAMQWRRKYKYTRLTDNDQPAFWGSTTIFVTITDFYHTCQAITRLMMSLSLTIAIGAPWYFAGVIWAAYATVHWAGYKMLSR